MMPLGFHQVLAAAPASPVVVGMESTGPYWLPLAHGLAAQAEVTVVLVHLAHVKRAKELDGNSPTKSDPKDAGVIARLVAEGRFQTWTPREGSGRRSSKPSWWCVGSSDRL